MTKICVVRHGETDWNAAGRLQGRRDIALNSVGLNQAHECCNYLMDSKWDIIISSSLMRAKQTAEIIQKKLDIPMLVMDDFIEMFFGEGEGLTLEERNTKFPNIKNYPGQESQEDLNQRIMDGLDKVIRDHGDKRIVLVAHGRVINDMLATFSDGAIDGAQLGLVNGCINHIRHESNQWHVDSFNHIGHLTQFSEKGKV